MRAIVTGHSRGLGAAIAETLLERGIPVLAISRHGNVDLATRFPDLLQEVRLDLTDLATLQAWVDTQQLERFVAGSACAMLVNNAGLLQPVAPLGGQSAAAIAHAVSANVTAPLMLANAFAADADTTHVRSILHVSSGAARTPYAGWSVYCATKAALDHHARAVAEEARDGVRICSLAPGVVDTEMQGEIRAAKMADFPQRERFAALKANGELQSPQHCAHRLVEHLLSDAFGKHAVADLRQLS